MNCDHQIADGMGSIHVCFRAQRHQGAHVCRCGVEWEPQDWRKIQTPEERILYLEGKVRQLRIQLGNSDEVEQVLDAAKRVDETWSAVDTLECEDDFQTALDDLSTAVQRLNRETT